VSWSRTYVGNPEKIDDELRKEPGDTPPTIRDAARIAMRALSPDRPVILETSGHIDAASGDFLIRVRNVDAVV
jgi:hypothetical protein